MKFLFIDGCILINVRTINEIRSIVYNGVPSAMITWVRDDEITESTKVPMDEPSFLELIDFIGNPSTDTIVVELP